MPIDPRLNCAAEICCGPPPGIVGQEPAFNQPAHAARVAILMDLGAGEEQAHKMSREMVAQGIVFLSADLACAIREIAFPATPPEAG